jgi:hypothetical protein
MERDIGGRGQSQNPDIPKAPDTQPNKSQLRKQDRKAYQREWYQQNRERAREVSRKWREQNRERVRQRKRERYKQNPERAREQNRKWREKNRQQVLEKAREANREYYQQNRERLIEKARERYRSKKEAKSGGEETVIFPDPSATPTMPESSAPESPRRISRRQNPSA